jgi:hydrogenase expression/formation protein HypE
MRSNKNRINFPLGKVGSEFLRNVVLKNLGAKSKDVITGPGMGIDNTVIRLNKKEVLILTSDPLSYIPQVGPENSAWLTINLLASDYTTSGNSPQYAMFDFNLPVHLDDEGLSVYLKQLSEECRKLGISIVGGHTGRYPGCDFTIVGGGFLFGKTSIDGYVTPLMADEGDFIILTKGAAIATTSVIAYSFPNYLKKELGEDVLQEAMGMLKECSTVREALVASSTGIRSNVTSMHDATEGGVLGGLYELSEACGKALHVNSSKIIVRDVTRKICKLFSLDPLVSLSEGTLIITCRDYHAEKLVSILEKNGIVSSIVGKVSSGKGLWLMGKDGRYRKFSPPSSDPYWDAYSRHVKKGYD